MHADALRKFQIFSVVVIHYPDPVVLQCVVNLTLPQVDAMVIVDNTPGGSQISEVLSKQSVCITVLQQQANIGLAAGLNAGIEFARKKLATHYLLLDQDSRPAPDMVDKLRSAWEDAKFDKLRIAAVGPAFSDERGGAPPPFLKVSFPFNHVVQPTLGGNYVITEVLITSGSLLSESALANTGMMNEWLFIDNVDLEWGFRAQALGWVLIGAPQAKLLHQIGDEHMTAPRWARWIFRRPIAVRHSDDRLYYIFRNRVALYKISTVPALWKLQDLIRLPFKAGLCLSISDRPLNTLKKMFMGIRDGLLTSLRAS